MRRSYVLAFILGVCCIAFALRTAWVVSQEPESAAAKAVQPLRSSNTPPPPPPPPPDRNAQLATISGDDRLTGASALLLLTMLREDDLEVARVAADILKLRVGSGIVVRGDPDSPERAAAVKAVQPFAKALGALLPHADAQIRADLVQTLACVGAAGVKPLGAALQRGTASERVEMTRWLDLHVELLRSLAPVLAKLVADPDLGVTLAACGLAKISGSGDSVLAKALVTAMATPSAEQLLGSGDALKHLPDAAGTVVPELRALLRGDGEGVRAMAAHVLRGAGDRARAAVPDLMKLARVDEAPAVRAAAFAALGLLSDPSSELFDLLGRGVDDPEVEVRRHAIVAMCEIGRPAVPLLSRCLIHERASVAEYAVWHLRVMEADLIRGAAPDLEANLLAALDNPKIFWDALRLLHEQEADPVRLLPHIRSRLGADSPLERRGALEFAAGLGAAGAPLLDAILALEQDRDSVVRSELAYGAARVARDDPRTLAFCRRLLNDSDARVRSGAVRGLDEFTALPIEMISELLQAAESQQKWRGVADPKARELLDAFDAKAARAELERILNREDENENENENEDNRLTDVRRARAQRWLKKLAGD